jgi:hypothetical protein
MRAFTKLSILTIALVATTASFAQADTSWSKAENLGIILGSESACGVTLDVAAIKQWIGTNVDASDMKFTNNLGLQSRVMQRSFTEMSPTFKEAHCAQIRRLVEKLGLGGPSQR